MQERFVDPFDPLTSGYRKKFRNVAICSCGKCVECKKAKQNEWYPRIVSELKHSCENGVPAVFVTLTYRDEDLPMTDEVTTSVLDSSKDSVKRFRARFKYCPTVINDVVYPYVDTTNGNLLLLDEYNLLESSLPTVTRVIPPQPTLRYKDVRMWLKRCRIRMQRGFVENECNSLTTEVERIKFHPSISPRVPCYDSDGIFNGSFKHLEFHCIGEYSPEKHRPHYHLILFGITCREFMEYFYWDWFDHFGITDCSDVDFHKRGELSKYLSKYCAKPTLTEFEKTDFFKVREPSRIHASKGFGLSYWRVMRDWHSASMPGDPVDIKERAKLIVDRLYYADGNFKYKLPSYYYDRIFEKELRYCQAEPRHIIGKVSAEESMQTLGFYETSKKYYTDYGLALSLLVKAELRKRAIALLAFEHPELEASYIERNFLEVRFNIIKQDSKERERKLTEKFVSYYRKSKFK